MSFRVREHKYKRPSYVQIETKEPVLDEKGEPVLDEEGNPTYKVVNHSGLSSVKSDISNKLGHALSSTMRMKTSDRTAECDYY